MRNLIIISTLAVASVLTAAQAEAGAILATRIDIAQNVTGCLNVCLDRYRTCKEGFSGRTVPECHSDIWTPCSASCRSTGHPN